MATVVTAAELNRGRLRRLILENLTAYAFLLPAGILITIFGLFPVLFAFFVSLHQWRRFPGDYLGLDNYVHALDSFAYDRPDVVRALAAFRVGHYSYWDALLLAAAERAGCRVMFTEDLHDGARFGEIEIINPFSASGLSPRARAALGL